MRLWSLHPQYLDSKGLVALWRESLLARKVLQGQTKGYKHHPQLVRFKAQRNNVQAINRYLEVIFIESLKRDYAFDRKKLGKSSSRTRINVTRGQLEYELEHLRKKLKKRDQARFKSLKRLSFPKPHPLFKVIPGKLEKWEKL
jgi:Pyrimidine dimer DNA glycosylase